MLEGIWTGIGIGFGVGFVVGAITLTLDLIGWLKQRRENNDVR